MNLKKIRTHKGFSQRAVADGSRRPEASTCCFTAAEVELIMAARDSDGRAMADALSLLKNHSQGRQNTHKENS